MAKPKIIQKSPFLRAISQNFLKFPLLKKVCQNFLKIHIFDDLFYKIVQGLWPLLPTPGHAPDHNKANQLQYLVAVPTAANAAAAVAAEGRGGEFTVDVVGTIPHYVL